MKIVKYEKDNCPGCDEVKNYCSNMGYTFDEVVDAVKDLTQIGRRQLSIMSVPVVILFNDENQEIGRANGCDKATIDELFEKRGK